MKHWWKILGILLVLYSLVAGLIIPLKSGVEFVTPENTQNGEKLTLEIEAYNTHFLDAQQLRIWLKLDATHYCVANDIQVLEQHQLSASFQIPLDFPTSKNIHYLTLIMDNEIDGYALLPDAVAVSITDKITLDSTGLIANADTGIWQSSIDNIHAKEGLTFPFRNILEETIRNLFYHVPLWFGMLIILFVAMIFSILYLITKQSRYDYVALSLTQVGVLYGILGLVTGAIWATWTWGEPWSGDVKQNMSAVAMLIYLAYMVLRSAFEDYEMQARISAVYNIFAFATLIPLLFVLPRLYDSLHPGNGGNPGFGGEDLDNTMRMVFYPSIIGWTLLGLWLANLAYRYMKLKEKHLEENY